MARNELTGREVAALQDALLSAFPKPAKVDRLLRIAVERDFDAIAGQGPLQDRIFEIIRISESEGWTDALIRGAHALNPSNVGLARFFEAYTASVQRTVSRDGLEKLVNQTGQLVDIVKLREALAQVEVQVGRVELDAQPLGTAFLVAPDVVLTNYHVIEGRDVSSLRVHFDYKVLSDGTIFHAGRSYRVVGPELDKSPYSPLDLVYPRDGLPTSAELDYALLALDGKAGDEMVSGRKRGFLRPAPGSPPTQGMLFIAQHPLGEPLQVASGSILQVNDNATRITYTTDTQPGSSGSPAFDWRFNLVALHHGGDPRIRPRAEFNEGIPIDTLKRSLKPEIMARLGWS